MSYKKLRFGITAAGLTCLLAGYVVAQQVRDTTQSRDETSNRIGAGVQSDRAQQRESGTTQRTQLQTRQSTSAQLGQRNAQAGGQNQDVERYLAACLTAKNQAEIELNQFAQQHAQNPQIQEFAQQMIQDHQQLGEQLQQVAGTQSGQSGASATSQSLNTTRQNDAQSSANRLPGSSGASQTETRNTRALTATGGSQDSGAIEQLIQIDQQIVQRQGEAVKEMLQQKQGREFDEAFLGTVVHAHVNMLAALETIEQQQGGQLTQVAQQARPVVQQHLDHAKQLKEQLKQGGQAGARAERQTPGTQRQR